MAHVKWSTALTVQGTQYTQLKDMNIKRPWKEELKKKKTGKPKIDKHNTETLYSVASNKQLTWITISCCAWHSSTLACQTVENNFKTKHRAIANTSFWHCCHGNATRALTANPPNSTQLGGIPYHAPKLHPGPCNSVGMRVRTDRHTQRRVTTIHIASSSTHAKCNKLDISFLAVSGLIRTTDTQTSTLTIHYCHQWKLWHALSVLQYNAYHRTTEAVCKRTQLISGWQADFMALVLWQFRSAGKPWLPVIMKLLCMNVPSFPQTQPPPIFLGSNVLFSRTT